MAALDGCQRLSKFHSTTSTTTLEESLRSPRFGQSLNSNFAPINGDPTAGDSSEPVENPDQNSSPYTKPILVHRVLYPRISAGYGQQHFNPWPTESADDRTSPLTRLMLVRRVPHPPVYPGDGDRHLSAGPMKSPDECSPPPTRPMLVRRVLYPLIGSGNGDENLNAQTPDERSPTSTREMSVPLVSSASGPDWFWYQLRRFQIAACNGHVSRQLQFDIGLAIVNKAGFKELRDLKKAIYGVVPALITILRQSPGSPESIFLEARFLIDTLPDYTDPRAWKGSVKKIKGAKYSGTELDRSKLVGTEMGADEWLLLEKIRSDCLGEFASAWHGLDPVGKGHAWGRLTIQLMQESPERLLEFLLVTASGGEGRPLIWMVSTCFDFLERFYLDRMQRWSKGSHTYKSVLHLCLAPSNWSILRPSGDVIRHYARWCDREELVAAFHLVKDHRHQISPRTAFYFMTRFLDFDEVDMAVEAWLAGRRAVSANAYSLRTHTHELLEHDTVEEGPQGPTFRILPMVLATGVTADRLMMNILIKRAFQGNSPQLGYDILRMSQEQGAPMSSYVYSELLRDAINRRDGRKLDMLIKEISQTERFRSNRFLNNKILHAYFIFSVRDREKTADPEEAFSSMLEKYAELYDVTPLKDLGLIPSDYMPPLQSQNCAPCVHALWVIIASYVRTRASWCGLEPIYERFRELVVKGHPTIAPLAEVDHIYNEFLLPLRFSKAGLGLAVQIVEDIMHFSSAGSLSVVHIKPTERVLNNILFAFSYNQHYRAAEGIRDMMREGGMPRASATWNIIITWYIRMQKIRDVAEALKAMEAQGHKPSSHTMLALRLLRNPERLFTVLAELEKEKVESADYEEEPQTSESFQDLWEKSQDETKQEAREILRASQHIEGQWLQSRVATDAENVPGDSDRSGGQEEEHEKLLDSRLQELKRQMDATRLDTLAE